jgi:hypothetical protein
MGAGGGGLPPPASPKIDPIPPYALCMYVHVLLYSTMEKIDTLLDKSRRILSRKSWFLSTYGVKSLHILGSVMANDEFPC